MRLGNRVHETSTSTGTGNITLAGAVSGHQTFNAEFGVGPRFTYWIDNGSTEWETGIGYLSNSTTLVRETPRDGSASTPVSFTGGDLDVFCAPNQSQSVPTYGDAQSNREYVSAHFCGGTVTKTLAADTIYYVPYLHQLDQEFDGFKVRFQTVVGTKFRMGMYSCVGSNPGDLLMTTGDVTPVTNSNIIGSITGGAQRLPVGWYYAAMVFDGADQIKGTNTASTLQNPMGIQAASSSMQSWVYQTETAASWTSLPSSAGTLSQVANSSSPLQAIVTV